MAFTPRTSSAPRAAAGAHEQEVVTVMTTPPPAEKTTVASETLDSIFTRTEQCKTTLLSDDAEVSSQLAAANLIEKLAHAVVAVKKLKDLGI